MVDRNHERISNLVMDMLTFSKEREPQKMQADLNETTADVVELMSTRAIESGVQLVLTADQQMPLAYFDPDAMHQAILNLVTNAIDAVKDDHVDRLPEDGDSQDTDATGIVNVKTGFDEQTGWYVDVIDNGPGVSPEDRMKVFSLFESKKGSRGTGLGLPVSAKILKEHGGSIEIIDLPSGTGCCFRLRLPPASLA